MSLQDLGGAFGMGAVGGVKGNKGNKAFLMLML